MSTTLALVSATAADRSRAIALWASALVLGLGAGPFVTAAATALAPWWTTFAPIALAALVVAAWLRAAAPTAAPAAGGAALDRLGVVLGTAAIAAGTVAVIQRGAILSIAAAVMLLAFMVAERRAAAPVLDLSLFARPAFDAAGLAAAATLFTSAGMVFVLGLFFTDAQHASPIGVALRLGCLFAAGGPVAARLEQRRPARIPLLLGLLLAAAGALALTTITPATSAAAVAIRLVVLGFGSGLVMSTASGIAVSAVARPAAPMAGAANNALRQLGSTLGPALLGATVAAHADLTSALHTAALIATVVLLAAAAAGTALLHTTAHHTGPLA